mmetsp:Transcript_27601/g.95428  ORF Transcript_27601/g.95428 Transcript_27601/m.95428 type:complete len:333 (-) Transcript_27601:52-1050(-)
MSEIATKFCRSSFLMLPISSGFSVMRSTRTCVQSRVSASSSAAGLSRSVASSFAISSRLAFSFSAASSASARRASSARARSARRFASARRRPASLKLKAMAAHVVCFLLPSSASTYSRSNATSSSVTALDAHTSRTRVAGNVTPSSPSFPPGASLRAPATTRTALGRKKPGGSSCASRCRCRPRFCVIIWYRCATTVASHLTLCCPRPHGTTNVLPATFTLTLMLTGSSPSAADPAPPSSLSTPPSFVSANAAPPAPPRATSAAAMSGERCHVHYRAHHGHRGALAGLVRPAHERFRGAGRLAVAASATPAIARRRRARRAPRVPRRRCLYP